MYKKNKMVTILLIFINIFLIFSFYPIYGDDVDDTDETLDVNSEIENVLTEETSSDVTQNDLTLNSRSCVVLDRLSKTIIYGKNEKSKVKMASTTKHMTYQMTLTFFYILL